MACSPGSADLLSPGAWEPSFHNWAPGKKARGKRRKEYRKEDRNWLVGRQPSGPESRANLESNRLTLLPVLNELQSFCATPRDPSGPIHFTHTLSQTQTAGGRKSRDEFMLWCAAVGICGKEKQRSAASWCSIKRALRLLAGGLKRLTCRREYSSSRTPRRAENNSHASVRVRTGPSLKHPA